MASPEPMSQSGAIRSQWIDRDLNEFVRALQECEEAVTACASVVFLEDNPASKLAEVGRDMDCADVLAVTRRVLTRRSGTGTDLLLSQLAACLVACEQSYDFCSTHADDSEEARRCSQVTSDTTRTLQQAIAELQR